MNISQIPAQARNLFLATQQEYKSYLSDELISQIKRICNCENDDFVICNDKQFLDSFQNSYICGSQLINRSKKTISCFTILISEEGRYIIGKRIKKVDYLAFFHDPDSFIFEKMLEQIEHLKDTCPNAC